MTITWRRLGAGEVDHERLWLVVALLALVGAGGVAAGWEIPRVVCPLKWALGLPCPGCGATRALEALLAGRALEALRFNPLIGSAGIVWGAWCVYAGAVLSTGGRRLRVTWAASDLTVARWSSAVAVLSSWLFLVLDGR